MDKKEFENEFLSKDDYRRIPVITFHSVVGYKQCLKKSHAKKIKYRELADVPIEALDLSIRAYNNLKRSGINTLGDILGRSIDDLSKIRNLNKKCLDEISRKVNKFLFQIENIKEKEIKK